MIIEELRNYISEQADEDALFFDNPAFDKSIIGVSDDGRVVYSLNSMIEELAQDDNITEEEAQEFIDYNTLRAIPYYQKAPIVVDTTPKDMYDIDKDSDEQWNIANVKEMQGKAE